MYVLEGSGRTKPLTGNGNLNVTCQFSEDAAHQDCMVREWSGPKLTDLILKWTISLLSNIKRYHVRLRDLASGHLRR